VLTDFALAVWVEKAGRALGCMVDRNSLV